MLHISIRLAEIWEVMEKLIILECLLDKAGPRSQDEAKAMVKRQRQYLRSLFKELRKVYEVYDNERVRQQSEAD